MLATTPELEVGTAQSSNTDYFASTTVLDHARGTNKLGQPVEGIALQYTSGPLRQRRSHETKLGNGSNASHISLQKKPGHNRWRDRPGNESKDSTAGSSLSSMRSEHSRGKGHRSPTQKNMLSKALAKANQAVLLDNAQNIQGATEAYVEACDILEQVMLRSSDIDDRKKLAAIRSTYSTRIAELYDLDHSFEHLMIDKELPEAPTTSGYLDGRDQLSPAESLLDHPSILLESDDEPLTATPMVIPPRQESLLPQIFGGEEYMDQQPPPSRRVVSSQRNLNVPMDMQYMPPPLSPRRPLSSNGTRGEPTPVTALRPPDGQSGHPGGHISSESISWLDMKDELASEASSRPSTMEFGRDDHLVLSIEADLDAAMNAAVEAAYEDDLMAEITPRPSEVGFIPHESSFSTVSNSEHVLTSRLSRESLALDARYDHLTREYLDEEAEEEEEILDMMMKDGLVFEERQLPGAMTALPRQSDSSGFSARSSGRTWESSITAATNATMLSTLTESPEVPSGTVSHDDLRKLEKEDLPAHQVEALARHQLASVPSLPSLDKLPLQDRRISGQGGKQLKIETFARRSSLSQKAQGYQPPFLEIPAAQAEHQDSTRSASGTNNSMTTLPLTPLASVYSADSNTNSPATPGLIQLLSYSTYVDEDSSSATSDQKRGPPSVRKNTSTSNLRPRNLSLATSDIADAPPTPNSAVFQHHTGLRGQSISTSAAPNVLSSSAGGGLYIFDPIAEPASPSSPQLADVMRSEPLPLEPCPEPYLLRPFWLMRCLYQALAHPQGGYLSTKLFVPRDIWRVKGVKVKAIDDKIGQCDFLTAALLRLGKVDTLDADAVLEELQQFETIIDSVRVALQKKLGSDVGFSGSMVAMKHSPAGEEADAFASKTTNSSVKSLASSWSRKLRSKSSNVVLTPAMGRNKETSADFTFPSIPITGNSAPSTSRSYKAQRHPPPTPTGMPHVPTQNASYMSSLARLFDAVQVLDSIARQVEDPGLKATSKTQVGLELSIRGAAEFFSFFVIRFALADVGLFMDKYLKRNSEWVMT